MLECIMRDALESAMASRRETQERIKAEVERHRKLHKEKWAARMKSYTEANTVTVEVCENPSPSGDPWFDNQENLASVHRGLAEMKAGKGKSYSIDEIRETLGNTIQQCSD